MVELIACDNIRDLLEQIVREKCGEGGEDACREGKEVLENYSCDEEWIEEVKVYVKTHAEEYYDEIEEYLG